MVSKSGNGNGMLHEVVLKRVRAIRLRKGLSQKTLAYRAGMTRSTYSRFEEKRKAADLDSVERVARALGADPETILGRGESIPDFKEEDPRGEGMRPCGCLSLLL